MTYYEPRRCQELTGILSRPARLIALRLDFLEQSPALVDMPSLLGSSALRAGDSLWIHVDKDPAWANKHQHTPYVAQNDMQRSQILPANQQLKSRCVTQDSRVTRILLDDKTAEHNQPTTPLVLAAGRHSTTLSTVHLSIYQFYCCFIILCEVVTGFETTQQPAITSRMYPA